jgi:site-specific DNA recombinase
VCKRERKKMGRKSKDKETEDKKTPLWAAIYARVSSPSQTNGYSLDEQIRVCRERCNRKGWKVRYIFKESCSGSNTDRLKFQLMLKKAREGKFDVLVFWKLDRFCRSLVDVVNVERELKSHGVSLHSATDQVDTTTSVGRFVFRSLASAAELERDLISERSLMGKMAMARQHRWPNGQPPLGYDINETGHLKVNNGEASLVRDIFDMYLRLRSMPQVAFELNKRKIKQKNGRKWSTVSIKNLLDNEIYIGKYKVAGVEDYVKDYQIIDQDMFEMAKDQRCRSKEEKEAMPRERKNEKVERILKEYFEFLKEAEEDEFNVGA